MKKLIYILIFIVLFITGCITNGNDHLITEDNAPAPVIGRIILATTTSTDDSGLLDYILPVFTYETGWEVDVVAVGTGAALQMGRDGQVDVLLVHSKQDEIKFVKDGYGTVRYDVMYNDFIIVGPPDSQIKYTNNVEEVFRTISNGLKFVSRGDDSGTNRKELEIWNILNIDPFSNPNYFSVGQGMGATLSMAGEMNAFTLSDRATWLNHPEKGNLIIICEGDDRMFNPYGVITVSGHLSNNINTKGGLTLANWLISQTALELIASFGIDKFGAPLFFIYNE